MSKIKWMSVIWALDTIQFMFLCSNLCTYLLMHLCEGKKKFHYISYTNFIFEVINIDFWQTWHFDVKDTGWVGLQLSIIFMQIVKIQYVSDLLLNFFDCFISVFFVVFVFPLIYFPKP